ncbi:hypothetical protein B0O80DRAFT_429019 [Mortierella sp. GBAus27b]|nr:hypothetical protein B0O80DRAFT_429019 [Mortierella sp. GBAus27b]
MEATQSFRLEGGTAILEISCDQEGGQNIIYWTDILDAFPGAQYVKNEKTLIKRLRDTCSDWNKCQRIKHYPGIILDVVLSGSPSSGHATFSSGHSIAPAISRRFSEPTRTVTNSSSSNRFFDTLSSGGSGGKRIAQLLQTNTPGSAFEQRLLSFLPPDVQSKVIASSDVHGWVVQAIRNGQMDRLNDQLIACLQDLKDEMTKNSEMVSDVRELSLKNNELVTKIKELATKNNELVSNVQELIARNHEQTSCNMKLTALVIKLQQEFNVKQDEMKELQVQALDQLSLLQNRVQAIITQTYELHEYPIPRLFVVLPQDTSSWNPKDLITNTFRLYFLCECGEHTKRNASKIPHHIHLAKHEGYEITRPKEFFQQYGHHVLTILKMLRFGISVVGVAVPAISHLLRPDALDRATSSLKTMIGNIQTGMEQAIGCLEHTTTENGKPARASRQLENNEALEGADLRKLGTFLKNKDGGKVLGNLYRTTTSEGHVKWVCIDHYRENYHEKTSKAFRDTVESMGGSYVENVGRVDVHIRSRIQADQFYHALDKAKSVYELGIGLDWDTTQNDFKKLRDCLTKSNVRVLRIGLHRQDGPASDILNRSKRHDPILDIMRHPSIYCVSFVDAPDDFIRRSSLLSRYEDFSNLRILEIELMEFRKDIPGLKIMISRMPNLTSLTMHGSEEKSNGLCHEYDALEGSLRVVEGRVKIRIRSRIHSELVSMLLETSKSLYGLNIDLHVDLTEEACSGTLEERIQGHDFILNIMQHPSTTSVVILGVPSDFIQQSSLLSTNGNFPNLNYLHIDLSASEHDLPGLKTMMSRMPNLMRLGVNDSGVKNGHTCDTRDTVVSQELSFEAIESRAKISLRSSLQAELVRQVLESTTSICGFDSIDLRVDLKGGSSGAISDLIRGHDSILDIMQHPSTRSVTIVEPFEDFIQQSSLLSRNYDFPNVKDLSIDLSTSRRDIPGLKTLVSRMANLTSLTVNDSNDKSSDVHGTLDAMGALGRSFEINSGRVSIHIRLRIQLDLVHQALESLQSIYGLEIDVHVDMRGIATSDAADRIQRHDSIMDIMRHPSTHSVTITGAPWDFIQQSSLLSRNDVFYSLKYFDLDVWTELKHDIPGLKTMLCRMPNLTHLGLDDSQHRNTQDRGDNSIAGSLKRSFEMDGIHVKIDLWSRIQAELISHLLASTRTINELDIELRVELGARLTGDIHDRIKGHDSIFDIMRHPSTRSVVLALVPEDFIRHSSMVSRNDYFPHLKCLDLDLSTIKHDAPSIKTLLSRIPNLTFLRMMDSDDRNTQIEVGSISLEPLYDQHRVNSNRVKLHLGSRELMELADLLLAKVASTDELDIGLYWETTQADFECLRDILAQNNFGSVKLHANMSAGFNGVDYTRIQRHDSLFSIMRHPSVQSVTIMKPSRELVEHSTLLSGSDDFSNLRSLDIDLSSSIKEDISGLKCLVAKAPNLSSLTFKGEVDNLMLVRLYIAVADYQKYPITFGSRSLCIPPWTGTSPQPLAAHQHLSHLLNVGGPKIDKLVLEGGADEEGIVGAFANVEGYSTGLKELTICRVSDTQGEQMIRNVANIISRSELDKIEIHLGREKRWAQVLEWIQWKHIRSLQVYVEKESVGIHAIKALAKGRDKMKGPTKLEFFQFRVRAAETSSSEQSALLRSFVASTSIKTFWCFVQMTHPDMEAMLKAADVSRLEEIHLVVDGYSSPQMDSVMDCLAHANKLQKVPIYLYHPTQEQKERMKARGVQI